MRTQETRIKKIATLKFHLSSVDLIKSEFSVDKKHSLNPKKRLTYLLNINYRFDKETNDITLIVSYQFFQEIELLHTLLVENVFILMDDSVSILDIENIKEKFLVKLSEYSLDHSRGIQAIEFKNTFLEKYLIPLIDTKTLSTILKRNPPTDTEDN